MKKFILLLMAIVLTSVLVACGSESSEEENNESANAAGESQEESVESGEDSEAEAEGEESNSEEAADEGDVLESDVGTLNVVKKNKDMEEVFTSGPMEISILGVQTADLEPSESYGEFFDNKDKVTIVTVAMKAENTSEDTISMYPNQATLTTNAGDQVDADLWLSDSVGGEFFGPTKKEGEVIFQLDTPAEEIESIKLIISGAHDENFETVGEDLQIEIEL
ncbi:LptM family lipoprotein [Oceanobacillus salinisoli]|uniref:LptM family lipoprotein n=1 Tax=Oceanobacillus salinisoli TaxID=2678611 RepID=UPI0018CC6FFB|nr:hypothetical protein [Oceanobacillus salinisoli]